MSDTPRLTAVYASIVHRMSREEYAHARGLADKIRAAAATGDLNAEEYGSHQNVLDAADLIDPTGGIEVITRDALIKLIAGGATCGGHYNCGPMEVDLREAADLLDAFLLAFDAATADRPEAESPQVAPSEYVATQVRQRRRELNLTRQQLADACARVGAPQLTFAALTNIETGRPDGSGKRRREVTVEELLALATALAVSPGDLMAPGTFANSESQP